MSDSDEKELEELMASLPIDLDKADLLGDITFEAQLLIRSRFLGSITVRYEDFKRIHEYSDGKEVLLTAELEGKRFVVYMSNGVIVSVAMSDLEKGERIAGLKPLENLIKISREKPIQFKLFEVVPGEEEKKPPTTEAAVEEAVVEEEREGVELEKKLEEFRNRVRKIIEDTAPAYGCQVVETRVNVAEDKVYVEVLVRKKGLFSRCKSGELKDLLESDLKLVAAMHDLYIPVSVEIKST
ncbi:MAG: hypothetical protein DRO13_01140 [Thermoprotei archaeon]|nr:MAG: hypothetical protein DRO13_01140 [Thermoprotei archaeon]